MTSLPNTRHLQALCRLYCGESGRSPVRVADLATGNPYFFSRLEAGKGCTVRTYNQVLQWFSDSWPPGLAWPEWIPHPAPGSRDGAGPAREDRPEG